jgi:5-methylcytosine-specific restriction endonuclease McrA
MYRNHKSRKWSLSVKNRDNYTCKRCNKNEEIDKIKVQAHHIKEYHKYPEYRYKLDNGVTLCEKCHYEMWYYSVYEKPINKNVEFFIGTGIKIPEEMEDNEYIESLKNCVE